jgi:hypothetical protein
VLPTELKRATVTVLHGSRAATLHWLFGPLMQPALTLYSVEMPTPEQSGAEKNLVALMTPVLASQSNQYDM